MNLFSKECYIHAHYHLYCPGCGGTRAVRALLHGNLLLAIKYNGPGCILFNGYPNRLFVKKMSE